MLGLLQLLALGLILALALATWLVMRHLRRPGRRTYAWAVARNKPGDPSETDTPRPFEAIEFVAGGVHCAAWDITGDDEAGPIVICTPGWADSKLGVLPRLDDLARHASRVIAWDPPGAGDTPGTVPLGTREPRMLLDIAHDVGRTSAGVAPNPIVLFGWSLGAGASIAAAALDAATSEHPIIAGVVAEAPYRFPWTPAFAVMRKAGLPWRVNGPLAFALMGLRLTRHPMWKGFDRAVFAAGVRCPLLVVHAIDDEVCPYADAQAIADAAPDATLVPIVGAGHNNLWTEEPYRSSVAAAVSDFLEHVGGPDTARESRATEEAVPPGLH